MKHNLPLENTTLVSAPENVNLINRVCEKAQVEVMVTSRSTKNRTTLFSTAQFFAEYRKKHPERRRVSPFLAQLREQRKLALFYGGLSTGYLSRIVQRATTQPGMFGANLVALLESRLDVVVYRSGFYRNIVMARQAVTHGHVFVNGERVMVPSCQLSPGDCVEFAAKALPGVVHRLMQDMTGRSQALPITTTTRIALSRSSVDYPVETVVAGIVTALANRRRRQRGSLVSFRSTTGLGCALVTFLESTPFAEGLQRLVPIYQTRHMRRARKISVNHVVGFRLRAARAVHLETSYATCSTIFLFSPQRVQYPFLLDVDLVVRALQ